MVLFFQLSQLPEHLVVNSTEYMRLQSHFSVLYTENGSIRNQLEECRQELEAAKAAHTKQIAQMEGEELMAQKQLRGEMVQLEDQLSQVRREYEMLRVEFEQNLAANEQSGPLNKEMRQLLAGFKMQNQTLKADAIRFKRKWREAVSLVAKTQKELDQERKTKENSIVIPLSTTTPEETMAAAPKEGEPSQTVAATEGAANEEQAEPIGELSESEGEAEQGDEQTAEQLKKKVKELTKKVTELKAEVEAYQGLSAEEKEKAQVRAGWWDPGFPWV